LGAEHTNGVPLIRAVVPGEEGRVWVGGSFTHFAGHPSRLLARLETDGRLDDTFSSPFMHGSTEVRFGPIPSPSVLNAIVPQPQGRMLVAGWMYVDDDPFRPQSAILARLHADGALDGDFFHRLTNVNPLYPMHSIAIDHHGRILAGMTGVRASGWLRRPGITNWAAIVRYHSDGQVDSTFQVRNEPAIPFSAAGVRQILVQSDGRIVFSSGIFTGNQGSVDGLALEQAVIGRLLPDGAWDETFQRLVCDLPRVQPADVAWFTVESGRLPDEKPAAPLSTAFLAQQPDGVLVLGGAFHAVNGEPRRRLARVDPSGALRGRLQLELVRDDPLLLRVAGEVEVPYELQTSTDFEHWSNWLFNGQPWLPVELSLPAEDPARFYRARMPALP
jgi:uncharacterized delta-60 repeat protein